VLDQHVSHAASLVRRACDNGFDVSIHRLRRLLDDRERAAYSTTANEPPTRRTSRLLDDRERAAFPTSAASDPLVE
jgi:hypothetical protein